MLLGEISPEYLLMSTVYFWAYSTIDDHTFVDRFYICFVVEYYILLEPQDTTVRDIDRAENFCLGRNSFPDFLIKTMINLVLRH